MASLPAPNSRPALRRIATRPPDDPQHHTPPLLPSVPTAPQTIMLLHFLPLIWLRAKIGIDRLDRILPIRHRKMGQNANRAQTGTTQIHRNPYFPFINPTRIRLVLMKLDRLIRTHTSRRTYKQRKYILATSAVFLDAHADLLCRLHDINKCTKNVGGGTPDAFLSSIILTHPSKPRSIKMMNICPIPSSYPHLQKTASSILTAPQHLG